MEKNMKIQFEYWMWKGFWMMISPEKVQTESLLFYVEFDLSCNEKRRKNFHHKILFSSYIYICLFPLRIGMKNIRNIEERFWHYFLWEKNEHEKMLNWCCYLFDYLFSHWENFLGKKFNLRKFKIHIENVLGVIIFT